MKRTNLGEFEELVLLTTGVLFDNAYSVAIASELSKESGRKVSVSAVHPVVYRLEEKGFLSSRLGDSTANRGGKRKRLFRITPEGKKVLDEAMALRSQLHQKIPKVAWQNS